MQYYLDSITQKSWQELQSLKKTLDFVLIGGWATYLYTRTLKSKDIDIIIDYDKLPKLEHHYQLVKNPRLNKYEAIKEEVQIDIYLPHYSKLGIPVEDLIDQVEELEGFRVLKSNYLLALKIYTLQQRGRSAKGRKDFIDILALVNTKVINWENVREIIQIYKLQSNLENFRDFLNESYEIPELDLNKHQFSRIKKEIIDHIKIPAHISI